MKNTGTLENIIERIDSNWEIKCLDKGFVRLVDSMGDDSSIAQAARVSYGKGTKTVHEDEGLIRYLMRHGHTTPFEMVQFKFHIKAPIFVFRQWHRHRMWSYNEYSGRYSEMKDEFYVPKEEHVTKQNPHNKQGGTSEAISYSEAEESISLLDDRGKSVEKWSDIFEDNQQDSRHFYEDYLRTGMRKELARINLPVSNYSEMYASVDLHNLFHFLKLRLDSHAQYEIRVFAEAIAEMVKLVVPIAYKAFEDYTLNSIKLNAVDIMAIRDLCGIVDFDPENIPSVRAHLNVRERTECIDKLIKIFKS